MDKFKIIKQYRKSIMKAITQTVILLTSNCNNYFKMMLEVLSIFYFGWIHKNLIYSNLLLCMGLRDNCKIRYLAILLNTFYPLYMGLIGFCNAAKLADSIFVILAFFYFYFNFDNEIRKKILIINSNLIRIFYASVYIIRYNIIGLCLVGMYGYGNYSSDVDIIWLHQEFANEGILALRHCISNGFSMIFNDSFMGGIFLSLIFYVKLFRLMHIVYCFIKDNRNRVLVTGLS